MEVDQNKGTENLNTPERFIFWASMEDFIAWKQNKAYRYIGHLAGLIAVGAVVAYQYQKFTIVIICIFIEAILGFAHFIMRGKIINKTPNSVIEEDFKRVDGMVTGKDGKGNIPLLFIKGIFIAVAVMVVLGILLRIFMK